jgi:alanine racemase
VDKNRVALKPVMRLMTKIIHLKKVPKGFTVSYNMTHTTQNPTLIATVPMGYADGYNRLLSSKGVMLVRGHKAPVVGRVCMDLTMLDVGHIPGVALGDEVVVFGCQDGESIPVEDLARAAGTISYEIYTRIGDRIQRVYVNP